MSESLKQKNTPSSAAEGLKSLEKRIGYNPTVREQLDTAESFREKLKQCKEFLNSAKYLSETKLGERIYISSDHISNSTRTIFFMKNIELMSEIITELKLSKAEV